jgi:hypothetical protein
MENCYNARMLALASPADLEAEIRSIETYAEAVPRVLLKASPRSTWASAKRPPMR